MKWIALFLCFAAACSGASREPATPASQPAQPASQPAPPRDARCPSPQVWVEPGCGRDAFTAGCYTNCARPGATQQERMNQAACGDGFLCTHVMSQPSAVGVTEACGVEDYLCLPR